MNTENMWVRQTLIVTNENKDVSYYEILTILCCHLVYSEKINAFFYYWIILL